MATIYHLPPELVLLIVETPSFPISALHALLITCRGFHDLLIPLLHKRASEHSPSPLHWSVANGFTNNIAPLIAAGCCVDEIDHANRTPLMNAVSYNYLDIARALLDSGARTDVHSGRFGDDGTALHIAARDGSVDMVALLLDGGADVNAREACGATPLHWAVSVENMGRESVVELLLDRGAEIDTPRKQDGETALKMAINKGDMRMFEILLERGAGIEVRGRLNETPLMTAAAHGMMNMVRILLGMGAKVGCRNDYGETALHLTAGADSGEMLRVILNAWDMSAEDKEYRFINIQNDEGDTALHAVTRDEGRKRRIEKGNIIRQLSKERLEEGGGVTVDPEAEVIAIQKAAEAGLTASVRFLLERGACPNHDNDYGRRPLHNAAANGYFEMAQLLVSYGAWIDAVDFEDYTALSRAAKGTWTMRRKPDGQKGRIDIIRLLLEMGAKTDGAWRWVPGNEALSDVLGDPEFAGDKHDFGREVSNVGI